METSDKIQIPDNALSSIKALLTADKNYEYFTLTPEGQAEKTTIKIPDGEKRSQASNPPAGWNVYLYNNNVWYATRISMTTLTSSFGNFGLGGKRKSRRRKSKKSKKSRRRRR